MEFNINDKFNIVDIAIGAFAGMIFATIIFAIF